MRSLRRAGLALALGGVLAANAAPTFAADNGTVDATVTVAAPCLTIDSPTGPIDFGTFGFSVPGSMVAPSLSLTYTNCSVAGESIYGQATDATGSSATWTAGLPGMPPDPCNLPLNVYSVFIKPTVDTPVYLTSEPVLVQALPGSASNGGLPFGLIMPCAGSNGAGELMSFQATFTATF